MAQSRRQRALRCEIHFQPDRHVSQKMAQVYHWLVPESEELPASYEIGRLGKASYEKERSHLHSGLH
jgi:hypothetical protein